MRELSKRVVGVKQTRRAIQEGRAARVYLAADALRVRRAGRSMASITRKTWAVRVAMPVSTKRKVVVVIVCDLLSNKCSFLF